MTFLVFLLALLYQPSQVGCQPQFAPLTTGTSGSASPLPFWRKSDAGGWGGSGWLGWTYDANGLRPVRLIVRDLPKTPEDEFPEVTVESVPQVTFAVRCVSGLRAGPISHARVVNDTLRPGSPLEISLGQRRYELRLESAREDLFDAKVVLTDGVLSQVLYSADGFADEPHFDVVWAGDLDRDGRLDLVVNLNRKYSVHPYRLLLSSLAAKGRLVGQAAVFELLD